jgi:hypothetical protein
MGLEKYRSQHNARLESATTAKAMKKISCQSFRTESVDMDDGLDMV